MARAKPQYSGQKLAWELPPEFSDELRNFLRGYYPYKEADEDPLGDHPADHFVSQILVAADCATSMLFHMQADITNEELRLECDDLLKALRPAEEKLRTISPDLDRNISIDASPLECADLIKQMIKYIENSFQLAKNLPKTHRKDHKEHVIAVEMAIRVLRILKDYGISPAEYATSIYDDVQSDAVKILKAIGDDIGIKLVPTTWRDIIGEAKEQAPDLGSSKPPING